MISKQYMIVLISAIAAMGVVAAFVCRHREPELPVLLPADWRAYVDASGEPLDRDAVLLYYRALMDRAEEHRIAGRLVDAEIYVQVSRQILFSGKSLLTEEEFDTLDTAAGDFRFRIHRGSL